MTSSQDVRRKVLLRRDNRWKHWVIAQHTGLRRTCTLMGSATFRSWGGVAICTCPIILKLLIWSWWVLHLLICNFVLILLLYDISRFSLHEIILWFICLLVWFFTVGYIFLESKGFAFLICSFAWQWSFRTNQGRPSRPSAKEGLGYNSKELSI